MRSNTSYMLRHKNPHILSLLLLMLSLTVIAQDQDRPFAFPEGVPSKLQFGMSSLDFKKVVDMRAMKVDDTRSWRRVYFQPSDEPQIKTLLYYIAKDVENQPLYEVIVQYDSRALASKKAVSYFGEPNYVGEDSETPNEWRFKAAAGELAKWVWVYKNQIVMVARVPGCEWDEDWDQ
ncbi:MAG: hypothetical protein R8G66_01070 [Cytophagales bacterium]|nr:hypothetical protein [Cytophagales bacterium]